VFGPASRTVTGIHSPLSAKIWVVPIFRHSSEMGTALSGEGPG
jgi:hypothetical protein